jgi:Arc/MetJ family transcription regulator
MSYRERIAFALFKTAYPEDIAATMTLERMPVTRTPIDDHLIQEVDTRLDWEKKRDRYLKLADAALLELDAIATEADAKRQGGK